MTRFPDWVLVALTIAVLVAYAVPDLIVWWGL